MARERYTIGIWGIWTGNPVKGELCGVLREVNPCLYVMIGIVQPHIRQHAPLYSVVPRAVLPVILSLQSLHNKLTMRPPIPE